MEPTIREISDAGLPAVLTRYAHLGFVRHGCSCYAVLPAEEER